MNLRKFTTGKQVLDQTILIEDVVPLPKDSVGLAVLGAPIKHSISPQLHNAALNVLSRSKPLFKKWLYQKIHVESEDLSLALPRLAECGYVGLNLTIPHKVDVIDLIQSIDEEAKIIGAVNTLMHQGGQWHGYNSDGFGLEKALSENLSFSFDSAHVLILGAGGAARAAAVQALSRNCEKVWIVNRSSQRLNLLKEYLEENFEPERISAFNSSDVPCMLFDIENLLIINSTSLGLKIDDPSPLSLSKFHSTTKVYDMIYNPKQTHLLKQAADLGMGFENGLSMLVYQASRSLAIWTKSEISSDAMFLAAQKALDI